MNDDVVKIRDYETKVINHFIYNKKTSELIEYFENKYNNSFYHPIISFKYAYLLTMYAEKLYKAIDIWNELIKDGYDSYIGSYYYNLSLVYSKLGDYELAIYYAEKAVDNNVEKAKVNIFKNLVRLDEIDIVKEKFRNSLDSENLILEMARLESCLGNYEVAINYFMKLNKKKDTKNYNLFLINLRMKKLDEARKFLELSKEGTHKGKYSDNMLEKIMEIFEGNRKEITGYTIKNFVEGYAPQEVFKHISMHKEKNETKKIHSVFNKAVDISSLLKEVGDSIQNKIPAFIDITDSYIVDVGRLIGSVMEYNTSKIQVVTLPESKEIINMYPSLSADRLVSLPDTKDLVKILNVKGKNSY